MQAETLEGYANRDWWEAQASDLAGGRDFMYFLAT